MRRFLSRLFAEHRAHTRLDLLSPPLLAEVFISIKPDGDRAMLVSKSEASPQEIIIIIQSIVQSGMDLAKQHGVQISLTQKGPE